MDEFKFRTAKISDVSALVRLFSDVKEIQDYEGMKKDKNYFLNYIGKQGRGTYVVEYGKKIVGSMNVEYEHEAYTFLVNMVVEKSFRGKGVGRILMKNLESLARKNKTSRIIFLTYAFNKRMRTISERYGYKDSGEMRLFSKKV
jgi:phosphinothricin acetyltransferase